jgi:hypothetical protein
MSDQHDGTWIVDEGNTLSEDGLATIRRTLDDGPVIVEHWFYYGSRAPDRFVFDDFDEFQSYLDSASKPGDSIYIWDYAKICQDHNQIARGKIPDGLGRIPRNGAY